MSTAIFRCAAFFCAFILFAGCNQQGGQASDTFNKDSLMAHIKVLASDEFMGRRPFTLGEEKTVDYLKSTYARLGTEPGNGSSYIQEVPLVDITVNADPAMKVQGRKGSLDLKNVDDYILATERTD